MTITETDFNQHCIGGIQHYFASAKYLRASKPIYGITGFTTYIKLTNFHGVDNTGLL